MVLLVNDLESVIEINIDDEILACCEEENIDIKNKISNLMSIMIKMHEIRVPKIHISIESASKNEIKDINREYRDIDKETDVLSFPIFTGEEIKEINRSGLKEIELGDIIICMDVVKEQAKEYETGLKRELLYMITHGVCHLFGYDHENSEDKNIMRLVEEGVLESLGVENNGKR